MPLNSDHCNFFLKTNGDILGKVNGGVRLQTIERCIHLIEKKLNCRGNIAKVMTIGG
jgi:hypothetical protein